MNNNKINNIKETYSSSLESLLSSSKLCISQIHAYCKANIKPSSYSNKSDFNYVRDLADPNIFYYMSQEQAQDLYKIICNDRDNALTLNGVERLTKRGQRSSLKSEIEKAFSDLFHLPCKDRLYPIMLSLGFSIENYSRMIYQYFNTQLQKTLLRNLKDSSLSSSFNLSYTSICEDIGNLVFDNYVLNLRFLKILNIKSIKIDDDRLIVLKSVFNKVLTHTMTERDYKMISIPIVNTNHLDLLNYKLKKIIINLCLAENPNFFDISYSLNIKYPSKAQLNLASQNLTEENKKHIIRLGSIFINKLINSGVLIKKLNFHNIKTKAVVALSTTTNYKSFFLASYSKPLLHTENVSSDYINHMGDLHIGLTQNEQFVHNNFYSYGSPQGYLKDPKTLNSRLTIDTDFYKNIFLPILDQVINKTFDDFTESSLQSAFHFLHIYQIDFAKIYADTPKDNLKAFKLLFDTALNFTIVYNKDVRKLFYTHPKYIPFKPYFNKIYSYKFFFLSLFHEIEIYSQFGYFIVTKYLSSIGRSHTTTYCLSLQGQTIIRAFVKFLPVKLPDEAAYINFRSSISQIIQDSTIRSKIENLDFSGYIQNKKELKFESLMKYFNSTLSKADFTLFLENKTLTTTEIFYYIIKYIKKKSKAFYVLSLIYSYNNGQYMYDLDSSQNGSQMIYGLIHGTKDFGQIANVIGNTNSDLYTYCVMLKLQDIKNIETFFQEFCPRVLGISLNTLLDSSLTPIKSRFVTPGFESFDLQTLSKKLVLAESKNSYGYSDYIIKLIGILDALKDKVDISFDTEAFAWILDSLGEEHVSKLSAKIPSQYFIIVLYYLRAFIIFKKLLKQYPWLEAENIIYDREFYKYILMAMAYGNTPFGRKETLLNQLIKKSIEHGIILKHRYEKFELSLLCRIFEKYFQKFTRLHMYEATSLLRLSQCLSEFKRPLIFETAYFKWEFFPFKKMLGGRTKIQNVFSGKTERVSLSVTKETIDKLQFKRKLPAIYTHSKDAYNVHGVSERMHSLTVMLEQQGYSVYYSTNHDCFLVSENLIPFLKYILIDVYLEFYNNDFLTKDLEKNNIPKEIIDKFIPQNDSKRIYKLRFEDINFNYIFK